MRTRLREGRGGAAGELEFYAHRYPHGYMHKIWPDHVERVAASVDFIVRHGGWDLTGPGGLVADLSCGDAAIAGGVRAKTGCRLVLADLVDGGQADAVSPLDCTGPIEDTALYLLEDGEADLIVLSETIEHLENPEAVLALLRSKTDRLFVSTPMGEIANDNPEHYWGWDAEGVYDLLTDCGFDPIACEPFTPVAVPHYTFQFWMCR